MDERRGRDVIRRVGHGVRHGSRLIRQVHANGRGLVTALDMRMVGGGIIHGHLQFVGAAGRVRDPLRNVHVDGFLIDRRGRWHTVVVCCRRFDGGVVVHVHRQCRGVGQSCLVFDRIHHVIGARLLRSGEGERIVRHGHIADVLRFDVFADGQVGVVSGDVVLRHGHGCCGVGAQCDFVVARVYARVGAGCEYAYADLRLGSLAGPVFDGV